MTICDKIKQLFRKEIQPTNPSGSKWDEPIDYVGVSFSEIQKDSVSAHKKVGDYQDQLIRKIPNMTLEELKNERKKVMKSMNSRSIRSTQHLLPQDIYSFVRGHLKSYLDKIENELKKRQSSD